MSEGLHESGCQEAATCRYDVSKDLGVHAVEMTHKVEIEETDGNSSRQKEHDLVVHCGYPDLGSRSVLGKGK